jgi:hypothetical protein
MKWRIGLLFSYIHWCFVLREVLPWEVAYVSNRELTKEEYEYPEFMDVKSIMEEYGAKL